MGVSARTYEKGRLIKVCLPDPMPEPEKVRNLFQKTTDWLATRHFYPESRVVFRKDHHIAMFYKHSVCINMAKIISCIYVNLFVVLKHIFKNHFSS